MLNLAPVFTPFPTLHTERCTLRALGLEDADALLRLWGNARVSRFLGRSLMTEASQVKAKLALLRERFEEQVNITWAITDKASGALAGTIMLLNIQAEHARSDIGYELSPDWWGKGIIPEVAAAVIDFGFGAMGLHSIAAQTDADNAASQRVLAKLGFAQEGHLRQNFYEPAVGTYTDTHLFGLLKEEWAARKPRQADVRNTA